MNGLIGLLVVDSAVAFNSFNTRISRIKFHPTTIPSQSQTQLQALILPSWSDLESSLSTCMEEPAPVSIDSVLQSQTPSFSKTHPTLFRERHGWCPYSERVWLALELLDVQYHTVRIDNTGGRRPTYFKGQTPQIRWPSGNTQGESMDIVNKIDQQYGHAKLQTDSAQVQNIIRQFSNIFPKRSRPSSRAAFLFQYNGDPLSKNTLQKTLLETNDLLESSPGPFFCGNDITAADVAWAPFLERYRYQLPCLHEGLEPESYPALQKWYHAMDKVPAYACRVKGDASSWRKVLTMAGFGNGGLPPTIQTNMDVQKVTELHSAANIIDQSVWDQYSATRPYLPPSPQAEAARIILSNREAILKDTIKRGDFDDEVKLDETLRSLVHILMDASEESKTQGRDDNDIGRLAAFLDERMCVPRDMGAMSAASIKQLAHEMS